MTRDNLWQYQVKAEPVLVSAVVEPDFGWFVQEPDVTRPLIPALKIEGLALPGLVAVPIIYRSSTAEQLSKSSTAEQLSKSSTAEEGIGP